MPARVRCGRRSQTSTTAGTIDFDIPGSGPDIITLTTGELAITKNLIIVGSTTKSLTISGNNASRVFNVNSGMNFTFSNLTIQAGQFRRRAAALTTSET
jgi:hypothetical protein